MNFLSNFIFTLLLLRDNLHSIFNGQDKFLTKLLDLFLVDKMQHPWKLTSFHVIDKRNRLWITTTASKKSDHVFFS